MARLPRLVLPGQAHLVIHRGQSSAAVFFDADDRQGYLDALRAGSRETAVAVHAYALAGNEVRLLVTPSASGSLAELMQFLGRRYVPAFNRKYRRTGTPWEGRFRSTVIETPACFAPCLRFVETGGVPTAPAARDEPVWSSLAHHLGARADPLLSEHPAFWDFGNTPFDREGAYRRYLEQTLAPDELASILQSALHGWAIGSPGFVAQVSEQTGRRARPAARGRPRHPKDVGPD